ncbi:MAG: L,D-transpeptidase [candidate division WOR-3 bacterium]
MRFGPAGSIGAIILGLLVIGWSELYLPLRESIATDGLSLARELVTMRAQIWQRKAELPRLEKRIQELRDGVNELSSRFVTAFTSDLYIVISTSANRLFLRRGEDVLREAVVSTGSNDTLVRGYRRWIFETPRGVMTVIRKKAKPVWIKPDWAFLEEGKPIPPWNSPLRRQLGVLGDYLLDLGGGVAIHGTDKEHLLGQSVTHGCIRVGKEDIKFLYDSVPVGTKVYIY